MAQGVMTYKTISRPSRDVYGTSDISPSGCAVWDGVVDHAGEQQDRTLASYLVSSWSWER